MARLCIGPGKSSKEGFVLEMNSNGPDEKKNLDVRIIEGLIMLKEHIHPGTVSLLLVLPLNPMEARRRPHRSQIIRARKTISLMIAAKRVPGRGKLGCSLEHHAPAGLAHDRLWQTGCPCESNGANLFCTGPTWNRKEAQSAPRCLTRVQEVGTGDCVCGWCGRSGDHHYLPVPAVRAGQKAMASHYNYSYQ